MTTKSYKPIPPDSAIAIGISGRKTQFFVPGDGIDREVIQGDICRYLDHDATVKPGEFNNQIGFFIFAYRNLTTEQIKDIKVDSTKLQKEREYRKDRYKQEQRKGQQGNKRKLEPQTQVPYTDSKTHTQSVLRYEEREQQRTSAHSPAQGPAHDHPPYSPPVGGLPTPMSSQRGGPDYVMSPPQAQPVYTGIVAANHYPRGPPTPESAYSQGSSEPRAPLEHRPVYDEDAYSDQGRSPNYGYAPPTMPQPLPGPGQAVAGRTYQPPPLPVQHQQVQRHEPQRAHEPPYHSYSDDRMDYRTDDRIDRRHDRMIERTDDHMEEEPADHRMLPPRMDSRAPPYASATSGGGMDGAMDTREDPPPRMQSRMDPPRPEYRLDDRDYQHEISREHRSEPLRMDTRAGTSVGMRPEPARDYRPDPRMDHRAGTSIGMRPEPYIKREDTTPRYDERREAPRDARSGYRDRERDQRQQDDRRRGGRG